MTCPDCEYHKTRAARWRAEAYKQAGHDVIELPWVGLTDEERNHARNTVTYSQLAMTAGEWAEAVQIETERRLKEKNT